MSKQHANMALDGLVNRPALVSPEYAGPGIGLGPEVTSGRMMADIQALADADPDKENAAAPERNRMMASALGFDNPADDKPFVFAGGFAIIPVAGLLLNRVSWSWPPYVTGYNFIRSQLAAAMADPDVKGVIFDVNSCGGTVAGCQETADAIFAARKSQDGKPILATVDANCHSAAYYLASQCDGIIVTPSGNVANIGVLRIHCDLSAMLDQAGIKITLIKAGAHKTDGNSAEPLPDDVRAEFQTEIDAMYDTFVAAVARGRGMDEQDIRDTEARCYSATDALALGLVDVVQNPSEAIEAYFNACMDDDDDGEMNDGDDPDADPDDEPTESNMAIKPNTTTKPGAATAASPETTQAAPEVTSEMLATAANDAAKAERVRVNGIMTHAEATGRESLAKHLAFNTEMSAEEAGAILAASAKEVPAASAATSDGTSEFQRAMDAGKNPNVGSSASQDAGTSGSESPAARILASQRAATGVKAPDKTVH